MTIDRIARAPQDAPTRQPAAESAGRTPAGAGPGPSAEAGDRNALVHAMRAGPATLAQRRRIEGMFGEAAQLKAHPDEEPLQRTAAPAPGPPAAANRTGLPNALKSGVEALSGVSLDGVKVHYDSPQPAQLGALAYAQGRDIHLGPGQAHHLPHEAWHVVQQAQGRVKPTLQMKAGVLVNDEAGLEHEADIMGARALADPAPIGRPPGGSGPSEAPAGVVQRQTATIVMPAAAPPVIINARPDLAGFDAPALADNGLATPARPANLAAGHPAYVANIVSTARGKDKTVAQIAAQYSAEAFEAPADAANRLALVVLANREDKPSLAAGVQAADVAGLSTGQAAGVANIPTAAGASLWRREWRAGPDVHHMAIQTVAQIRATLDGAANPAVARGQADTAAAGEGLPPGVPNAARNAARAMPSTAGYVAAFTGRGYTPYVHVADADAVTLRATEAAPGIDPAPAAAAAAPAERALFPRYDEMIAAHPAAEALSGGYRFAPRPPAAGAAPPHAAGATSPGLDLMARTDQAVKTSQLDVAVRTTMQGLQPGLPYFPEPNLVVRGDLFNAAGVGFGDRGPEWEHLKTSLTAAAPGLRGPQLFAQFGGVEVAAHGLCTFPVAHRAALEQRLGAVALNRLNRGLANEADDPAHVAAPGNQAAVTAALSAAVGAAWTANKPMVFDRRAALVTDVGRFDDLYANTSGGGALGSGVNYLGGARDPLAPFDSRRAKQSHAQLNAIKTRLTAAYGLLVADPWLESAARTFLPHGLFEELSATGPAGALAARTTAANLRFAVVRPQLQHFAAFTTAVAAEVAVPGPMAARATHHQGAAAAMTDDHRRAAVADRLAAHPVPAGFLALLDAADRLNIWNSAQGVAGAVPAAAVAGALKAIGDAIAAFLAAY